MKHYYLEIIDNKEYREDGTLMYEETRVILDPKYQHLFNNQRIDFSGNTWIRINRCVKYKTDGSIEWLLEYEEDGSVKSKNNYDYKPSFRSSGKELERAGQAIQGQIPFV